MLMDGRFTIIKMLVHSKLIYIFNIIPIEISEGFFFKKTLFNPKERSTINSCIVPWSHPPLPTSTIPDSQNHGYGGPECTSQLENVDKPWSFTGIQHCLDSMLQLYHWGDLGFCLYIIWLVDSKTQFWKRRTKFEHW